MGEKRNKHKYSSIAFFIVSRSKRKKEEEETFQTSGGRTSILQNTQYKNVQRFCNVLNDRKSGCFSFSC